MKCKNTILKLFKGCRVSSVDVIDGVLHVFRIALKKYNTEIATYKFYVPRDDEKRLMSPMDRMQFERERRQENEMIAAFRDMVDGNTIVGARALETYGNR